MVDSVDKARLQEAREDFHGMLADSGLQKDVPILVLANKQDLPDAISLADIEMQLDLAKVKSSRKCAIMGCSVQKRDSVEAAMHWASGAIKEVLAARK